MKKYIHATTENTTHLFGCSFDLDQGSDYNSRELETRIISAVENKSVEFRSDGLSIFSSTQRNNVGFTPCVAADWEPIGDLCYSSFDKAVQDAEAYSYENGTPTVVLFHNFLEGAENPVQLIWETTNKDILATTDIKPQIRYREHGYIESYRYPTKDDQETVNNILELIQEKIDAVDQIGSQLGLMNKDYADTHPVKIYDDSEEYQWCKLTLYGGRNGGGLWSNYFNDLADLMLRLEECFEDVWIIDVNCDCCDDVFYIDFGVSGYNATFLDSWESAQ